MIKRLVILISLLVVLLPSAEAEYIYPQREVYLPSPLQGEIFTISNSQILYFPSFQISLHYETHKGIPNSSYFYTPAGDEFLHMLRITELQELVIWCGNTACGTQELAVTFERIAVQQGMYFATQDRKNGLIYMFRVIEEERHYIVFQCNAIIVMWN